MGQNDVDKVFYNYTTNESLIEENRFLRETVENIQKELQKYKLIITSGSDYHGPRMVKLMPGNHDLGKNSCDEKVIKQLISFAHNTQ